MAVPQKVIVELSTQDRHILERIGKGLEKLEKKPERVVRSAHRQALFEEYFGQPFPELPSEYPYVSEPGSVLVLAPELFLSEDERVMSYKGQEYYKPCGKLVFNRPDGGQNFCVKIDGHVRQECEDSEGRINTGFVD